MAERQADQRAGQDQDSEYVDQPYRIGSKDVASGRQELLENILTKYTR